MAGVWSALFFAVAIYGIVTFVGRFSPKNTQTNDINWSGWEAVGIAFFIYFAGQIIGSLLAAVYPKLRGWSAEQSTSWLQKSVMGQFWLILLIEVVSIGLLYLFLRRRKASFKTIGLTGRPRLVELGYVLLGYAVYFVLYIIAISIVKSVIPAINLDQQQQVGFETAHGLQLLPVFVSLVILPPIAEELLMRGFLFSGLKQALPLTWAIIGTSTLFAVAHLQAGSGAPLLWVAAIDTFVLSCILIQLRQKTGGKLWAPMGLHALKNLIAFLSLFVFQLAK